MSDQTLWLEVLGQEGLERALPQRGKIVLGGSVKQADVPLEGLADAHCAIGRLKDGGWAIQDLGSRAGTSINGESVRSAKLAHGDVIALGSRRLRVYDPERSEELVFEGNQPPPERLAGFRVEKRIGKGSMGEVFRAEQESLHRPVALKVLCPRLSNDPNFVASFLSEARAAAALSHANVVHVYDVGEADGRHYLAMEYMDQGSLEERVARGDHGRSGAERAARAQNTKTETTTETKTETPAGAPAPAQPGR